MFLDEASIDVLAGDGGRGTVGWRREKFEPMGGPNGGDGGRGGDVYFIADRNTDTLSDYASRKRFAAARGDFGGGKNMGGHDGEDLFLKVPPGTIIRCTERNGEPVDEILADLESHGDQAMAAKGGRGGFGNAHFKSSVRQAPDFAELGEKGEHVHVQLELRLVADVGIIGFPNVGKSTLISVVSAAKPKIANYPFTTLVPNLGVVTVGDRSFVLCDIPGLIEGASEGKGLGHEFLRHVERCGILLHLIDVNRAFPPEGGELDPGLLIQEYRTIRKELEKSSATLAAKNELVVLNKIDLIPDHLDTIRKAFKKEKIEVAAEISAATTEGTKELMNRLMPIVVAARNARETEIATPEPVAANQTVVLRPHLDDTRMGAYRIDVQDGGVHVTGKRIEQFTQMTDFSNSSAVDRFRDVLDRTGLRRAIKRARPTPYCPVTIGKIRVEAYFVEGGLVWE
ncbi:MAG: GTPase ObgE [Candidatus Peribacteraceae bacterium]|nr:GTPase ObgE [Candidatus Peribacteraceae bacterium]